MPINDSLFDLLKKLDDDELCAVWAYLGMSKTDDDFAERRADRTEAGGSAQKHEPISRELRRVAGHSIANVALRRAPHEYPWGQVLRQIADKLEVAVPADVTEEAIEEALLRELSCATREAGETETLNDARCAAEKALEVLVSKAALEPYKGPLKALKSAMTGRAALGPNYHKLVPAVFFILSAARTFDAFKKEIT